ncbi:scoloptoxin SSD14-like isoform X2 [Ornithodoros turicata]|uniref:scoloptoxin SSD14-like isoform X2 n=1 Tax=Ornithodoros turicata TaxID=34597 RepID=UPI003138D718
MSDPTLRRQPASPNAVGHSLLHDTPWECLVMLALLLAVLAVGAGLVIYAIFLRDTEKESRTESRASFGDFHFYAASTDAIQCAPVTRFIIERNGSVTDAAIATLLCACVVLPHSVGIGGGFVALIYDKTKNTTYTLDAREVAPLASNRDMFIQNTDEASVGGRAVAVPGLIDGLGKLHQRFGRLPWGELFTPAINLARYGFPVGPDLSGALASARAMFETNVHIKNVFWNNVSNTQYKEGEIIKQPLLAETLQAIGNSTSEAFYDSDLSDSFVRDIKLMGGIISKEDLRRYESRWRQPATVELQDGSKLYSSPSPSSGPILLYIAAMMGHMKSADSSSLLYHRMVEIFKYAYAKINEMADEDFADITRLVNNMISPENVKRTLNLIDDNRTYDDPKHYGLQKLGRIQYGSSHFSFLSPNGDAISLTSSLGEHFGARCMATSVGVILNNHMSEFTLPRPQPPVVGYTPNENNYIVPGKRPVTTMAPCILVDKRGDVALVLGASGGSRIASSSSFVQSLYPASDPLSTRKEDPEASRNTVIPRDRLDDTACFPCEGR